MDYKTNRNNGNNGNRNRELQHGIPMNEGAGSNTRHDRDYANHEKAVTQPTPSTDKSRG